jgi:hypothetical protein
MTDPAKNITNLYPDTQVSPEKTDEKPWQRQQNEPAKWFMRFNIYLDLGPKRTMQAAIDAEPTANGKPRQIKQPVPGKPQKVSIPGSWSRAAKIWRWKERSEAYDLAIQKEYASFIRKSANECIYASKAYRIKELNNLAQYLKDTIKAGMDTKDLVAIIARLQSVMRDISLEMQGLDGVTTEECDAAALQTMVEYSLKKREEERLKSMDMHERNQYLFDKFDTLN